MYCGSASNDFPILHSPRLTGRMPAGQVRAIKEIVDVVRRHKTWDLPVLTQVSEEIADFVVSHYAQQPFRHHRHVTDVHFRHVAALHGEWTGESFQCDR